MTSDSTIPKALVTRWDGKIIHIRCPYCFSTHRHLCPYAIERASEERRSCVYDDGNYALEFPSYEMGDRDNYGWEFDPETLHFNTMCRGGKIEVETVNKTTKRTLLPTTMLPDDKNEENDLIQGIRHLNLNEGRILQYFEACRTADINRLETLFQQYQFDDFATKFTPDGDNGATLAAATENGRSTLQWLIGHRVKLNHQNHFGRTPLMEAALWGYLDTVRFLSAMCTNLHVRDGNGMRALDLATLWPRNLIERGNRKTKILFEPVNADNQRAKIRAHLRQQMLAMAEDPRRQPFESLCFRRDWIGDVVFCQPLTSLTNLGSKKAIAIMDRGSMYPIILAVSGYSGYCDYARYSGTAAPIILDNLQWTIKAEKLQKRFHIPLSRCAASHVEPQLLAYLIERHSLEMVNIDKKTSDKLAMMQPKYKPQALITVNKSRLCSTCERFVRAFRNDFPDFEFEFRFSENFQWEQTSEHEWTTLFRPSRHELSVEQLE